MNVVKGAFAPGHLVGPAVVILHLIQHLHLHNVKVKGYSALMMRDVEKMPTVVIATSEGKCS